MTQKLYYEDVYLKEFDASVTDCREEGNRFGIVLDRCAFYPEGGGQSADRGFLIRADHSRVEVLDVREQGEEIVLTCSGPVSASETVHGVLDWEYRFDRMQNHSGEHIVSGLIHECYGFNNVGFHMSQDRMTIDLDGEIPEEGLREIERRANEIVWANVPVRTDLYTPEEAARITYRSKKELSGMIRVVSIPGADVCACCGTHVAYTGEIGLIKLLSHERFKGGVRMEMMCGRWAYRYIERIFRQNHEVSVHLSSPMEGTGAAAGRIVEENSQLKGRLIEQLYQRIDQKAAQLEGAGDVVLFIPGGDSVAAQKLTAKVMETCKGAAFSFAGNDQEGYKYAAGLLNGDLKDLIREMNSALNGRGGGKPFFQQGSVSASRQQIGEFFRARYPGLKSEDL